MAMSKFSETAVSSVRDCDTYLNSLLLNHTGQERRPSWPSLCEQLVSCHVSVCR